MLLPFLFLALIFLPFSSSTKFNILKQGSSLSPPQDVLISSPKPLFTAGFYPVGDNAYCFSIWFSQRLADGNLTVVWMANRDQPVNGRNTKLSLSDSGNLILTDADRIIVWTSGPDSTSSAEVQLLLLDTGNLVLRNKQGVDTWQSFDSPTDTLLPLQQLTRNVKLVSPRSPTNQSSGFYKLYFDNDNVLRLIYDGVEITSVFWPAPWLNSWQAGRSTYNNSKTAVLDSFGRFVSSDELQFKTSDFGLGPQRRITLDPDGNARVYSLDEMERIWKVTWQATTEPCKTHGICGENALCTYRPEPGPKCACVPGYKIKNDLDWSEGCVPEFNLSCNDTVSTYFLKLSHVEFYGYDIGYYQNYTLDECEKLCLSYCNCKGFQYKFEWNNGFYSCFPKTVLFNGYQSTGFEYWAYIRLPKSGLSSNQESVRETNLACRSSVSTQLSRSYKKRHEHGWLKSLLWGTGAIGAFEIMCLITFLYKTRKRSGLSGQRYIQVSTAFKRFSYQELKKASGNFSEEIGRGGSGIVYKGKLAPDNRLAAIKCLKIDPKQGEAEFLAEVGIIGRLNHVNLIEPWGYCAEGKHRLLVYEYLEHGSLAENLALGKLDWKKRFDIALGTAKGLAYLHEECLEWVLHCDVKPQNILLDSCFHPKVADFGLSKLLHRGSVENNLSVSRIRGTRGYMAPEWVFHLPITSKVDVYSYGIVVLEMVTGKGPKGVGFDGNENGGVEHKRLVSLIREIMKEDEGSSSLSLSLSIEKIVDPSMGDEYDVEKMVNLVKVALQCAQENKEGRPSMRQVVDMLLGEESHAPDFEIQ